MLSPRIQLNVKARRGKNHVHFSHSVIAPGRAFYFCPCRRIGPSLIATLLGFFLFFLGCQTNGQIQTQEYKSAPDIKWDREKETWVTENVNESLLSKPNSREIIIGGRIEHTDPNIERDLDKTNGEATKPVNMNPVKYWYRPGMEYNQIVSACQRCEQEQSFVDCMVTMGYRQVTECELSSNVRTDRYGWARNTRITDPVQHIAYVLSPPKPYVAPPKPDIIELIEDGIKKGVFHSIDIDSGYARIDPAVWLELSIEAKQGIVLGLREYFIRKGKSGRLDILSNRNDQKLASYSVWSGVKIFW